MKMIECIDLAQLAYDPLNSLGKFFLKVYKDYGKEFYCHIGGKAYTNYINHPYLCKSYLLSYNIFNKTQDVCGVTLHIGKEDIDEAGLSFYDKVTGERLPYCVSFTVCN